MTQTIEILHVRGCPGAPEAARVALSLAEAHGDLKVVMRIVEDERSAAAAGFRGSPTVLVDGADVEEDPATPLGTMG